MTQETRLDLQRKVIGALIGMARATDGPRPTERTFAALREGLTFLLCGEEFHEEGVDALVDRLHREKSALVPRCATCASPCGRNNDYDFTLFDQETTPVRVRKATILAALPTLAQRSQRLAQEDAADRALDTLLLRALFAVGESWNGDELQETADELGDYLIHI